MLEGKDVSYSRGFLPLFSGISFTLSKGDILAVKGANGSGKSTFLRLLTGLIHPPSNVLFWEKQPITRKNISSYQQNLLYIGHKLCLHPEALVKDQMSLWANFYGISKGEIKAALEIWGVATFKDKKISHLSQGQQKRLSLSRCSWLKRSLWILDEPQAGLDQEGQEILSCSLSRQLKKGGCIILATHESISMNPLTENFSGLLRLARNDKISRHCEAPTQASPRREEPWQSNSLTHAMEILL